ncbi:hypothetical protein NG796_04245 [Laspinema sp. A4]|nr:hypothetical protein [Laspinema sp. D2d]
MEIKSLVNRELDALGTIMNGNFATAIATNFEILLPDFACIRPYRLGKKPQPHSEL